MQQINSSKDLADAISILETKRKDQGNILREQFYLTYESLKPLNIIKNTLKDAATSGELKDNIMNTSVGLAAGYISKKVFEGVSNNPLKKLFGSALMFGITNIVTRNPETMKLLGSKFLNSIRLKPANKAVNGINKNEIF